MGRDVLRETDAINPAISREDLKSDAFYFVNNVAPWQDLVCANLWRLTEHYDTDCHFFLNDLIDPN
jgi:hypothetical protein